MARFIDHLTRVDPHGRERLRFIGMLDAEVDRKQEVLRVNALHELLPWEPEESEMVRAEIAELGEWLGMPVVGLG